MKLSTYAKQLGVSYKTVFRLWQDGKLDAYQLPTGTVIVREPPVQQESNVALYARVSSSSQKDDLEQQRMRLQHYAVAKGYQVTKEVMEVASGLNDHRPKLEALLKDLSIGIIVVENRDRLTRFGSHYIETLLETQGRRIEIVFPSDTGDDLVDDFVAVITSMAARIYGRRGNKIRVARIKDCIEHVMQAENEKADDE